MTGRAPVWLAVVPLLALGVLLGLSTLLFESFEETEARSPSPRARANPLLALEWTLDRLGFLATSSPELRVPDTTDEVLVLFPTGGRPDEEQRAALLAWVELGGVLVYSPPDFEPDPLLDSLGVALVEPLAVAADLTVTLMPAFNGVSPLSVSPVGVAWLRDGRGLGVGAGPNPDDPSLYEAMLVPYGDGAVLLLADTSPWSNAKLAEADNARYFHALLSTFEPSAVHLVYRVEQEGMIALLLRLAWPVTVSGACLLLAWLWLASRRFGTVYDEPPRERRRLLEHLDAVGSFLGRRHQAAPAVERLRAAVLDRIGPLPEDPEARVRQLSRRTGADEATVRRALTPLETDDATALIETVQALETLRRNR